MLFCGFCGGTAADAAAAAFALGLSDCFLVFLFQTGDVHKEIV